MSTSLVLAVNAVMPEDVVADVKAVESGVESCLNDTARLVKTSFRQSACAVMDIGKGKDKTRMLVTDRQNKERMGIELKGEQPAPIKFYMFAKVWEDSSELGMTLAIPADVVAWLRKFPAKKQ